MKTYNRAGKLLRIIGVNDPLKLYETSHDHRNSSVYSFRVEVSRANSRYILDIEFLTIYTVSDRDPGYNPGYCRDLGFCRDPGPGKISLFSPGFHRDFIEKK